MLTTLSNGQPCFQSATFMVHVWFEMCCVEPSSRCGGYPRSQQSDTTQIVNTTVIPLISIKSHSSNHRRDLCKLFQMTFQLCYSQYLFLLSTSTMYNNPYLDIRQIHLKVSMVISPVTPPSCRQIPGRRCRSRWPASPSWCPGCPCRRRGAAPSSAPCKHGVISATGILWDLQTWRHGTSNSFHFQMREHLQVYLFK